LNFKARLAYCRVDRAEKSYRNGTSMTIASQQKLKISWHFVAVITIVHLGGLLAFLNFSWQGLLLALVLHWITGGLGITLGWHRLISHRSFQVPKWLEYFFVFCGSLSLQGGPIWWVGLHRHHHVHSDQSVDHHDSNKGFWWSHMGWMFHEVPAVKEIPRFTKDIANDPVYRFFDNYFFPMQIAFGFLLFAIGTHTAIGGLNFVLWGIFARLMMVYHCTWLVNSATHMFGYQSHKSDDNSRNCWWVAVLTYGEGWHNNHHAYQYSARHGLRWWEIDFTWMTISLLKRLGLASKVKVPNSNG
jgi:sn-1 stearoyl-lipid 9-desaturase